MGDTKEAEPPVKVDPRSIQDALRLFFPPTRTGDPRTDFYSAYQKEAAEYDTQFVNQYDEDLNTTLIFAGLFSAVCSAFAIDTQRRLEPDPGDRSVAYLQAILQTLQDPGSSGAGTAPLPWVGPSPTDVTVSVLLYTSLCTSLLAAFLAMLGKQWLTRYAKRQGGSTAERCEDRQRKLNGLERWPFKFVIESLPVLLQFSLVLLAGALTRFLWDINRVVAFVVMGFTTYGMSFYACIVFAGTLSYECPFQTPLSLILRNLGVNRFAEKLFSNFLPGSMKPNPDADCVFWTLKLITDPEVILTTLKHLTSIKWYRNPPERAPLVQVARIYVKCFGAGHRVLLESKQIAYAAGMAFIQLYLHRLSSDMSSEPMPQVVADAFYNLYNGNHDDDHRPLALIAKSIQEPGRFIEYQRDLSRFDLDWISEIWMHHVWVRRSRSKGHRFFQERAIPADLSAFFEREEAPPPHVARNLLRGFLFGISSIPRQEDLILLEGETSDSRLLKRLEDEMMFLTERRLLVLRDALKPLTLWKHGHAGVVTLCCNLLKRVVKRGGTKEALPQEVIHLLCQIAFRTRPTVAPDVAGFDNETLIGLIPLFENGNEQFLSDLIPVLSSAAWDEERQRTVIRMLLTAPVTSFSKRSLPAVITAIGKARWSVVEAVDRETVFRLVRGQKLGTLVERIVGDDLVCAGWMRFLLHHTSYTTFNPNSDPTPWRVLLFLCPKCVHLFSPNPQTYIDETPLEGVDWDTPGDGATQKRQVLWLKLFWSSRFFELGCASWARFESLTTMWARQSPSLLQDLEDLCASSERDGQDPSLTYSAIYKIRQSLSLAQGTTLTSGPPARFAKSKFLQPMTPHAEPSLRSSPGGEVSELGKPVLSKPKPAPKDTPKFRPPVLNQRLTAPQDTPPFNPGVGRRHPTPQFSAILDHGHQLGNAASSKPMAAPTLHPPLINQQSIVPQDTPPFDPALGRRHSISQLSVILEHGPSNIDAESSLGTDTDTVSDISILPNYAPDLQPLGEAASLAVPVEYRGDTTSSLSFWMRLRERGHFDPAD